MKRTLTLLLCLALALSIFAGCQPLIPLPRLPAEAADPETTAPRPLTAEEVRAGARERLEAARSMGLDLNLDFSAAFELGDDTANLSIKMNMPGVMSTAPLAFRWEGELSAALDGEPETERGCICMFLEDGGLALYTKGEEDENFQKYTASISEKRTDGAASYTLPRFDWELETGETQYVLTHTVDAAEAERFSNRSKLQLGGLELKDLIEGTRLRLTVDRETLEPRELVVDLSDSLRAVIQQMFEQILEETGGQAESLGFRIGELRFALTLGMHDYDGAEPIEAPTDYEDMGDFMEYLEEAFGLFDSDPAEPGCGTMLDELDDGYRLEDFSFRLSEVTPRDFVEEGWTLSDAIPMGRMGADNPYGDQDDPENGGETEANENAPGLSEDGILDPGGLAQLYLRLEDREDDGRRPLRLGVVNTGEEPLSCLDCPVYFFSVNETYFYEGIEEGPVDFTGPAGIEKGMSREEITALLGEPYYEGEMDEFGSGLFYLTNRYEELALLLDGNGALAALFYQDLVHYDPADYVFHN